MIRTKSQSGNSPCNTRAQHTRTWNYSAHSQAAQWWLDVGGQEPYRPVVCRVGSSSQQSTSADAETTRLMFHLETKSQRSSVTSTRKCSSLYYVTDASGCCSMHVSHGVSESRGSGRWHMITQRSRRAQGRDDVCVNAR